MHVNGFTYGPLTPLLAYFMSFLGAVIGLQSASRALVAFGASRFRWLAMAAMALGGTAIWVTHFIAMLGFTVPGTELRYDPLLTVACLVLAIVVAGVGLTLATARVGGSGSLLAAGFVTGSGVAGLHYLGMAALHLAPGKHYDVQVIAASVAIAIAGTTAAFWLALRVRGFPATIGAGVVLAAAVTETHYTGMAALHLTAGTGTDSTGWADGTPVTAQPAAAGLPASELLTPLILGIGIATTIMLLIVAMAPTERELREEQRVLRLASELRERARAAAGE